MKLSLFIFLSLFFCGCSSKREVIEKYMDGSPKKIIDHIDQNRYYVRELYPNGNLKEEKFFKNGVQDSMQDYYTEEGKKIGELSFKNGLRNGVTHEYYRNGQMAFEGYCINGKFEGISTWYYRNGNIQAKGGRHLGADTGRWESFDTAGILTKAIVHGRNGKVVYYNGFGIEISAEEWEKIPSPDQKR